MIEDERLCIWTWRRMLEMTKEEWNDHTRSLDRAVRNNTVPVQRIGQSRRKGRLQMSEQTWGRIVIILMLAIFMVVIAWLQGEEEE